MFKRLAKSKRHSIEGLITDPRVPGAASPSLGSPSASQTATVTVTAAVSTDPTNSNLGNGRAPRAKQARRSCGDQPLTRLTAVKANDQQRRNEELEDEEDEEDDDDDEPRLRLTTTRVNSTETDYQMVTAVPAYIVEHEPEKQKGLVGVWGRRMSKKIDSFRRSSSRDSTPPDQNSEKPKAQVANTESRRYSSPQQRSASPFKSFFIRMGSTGMLNSTKGSRRPIQSAGNPKEESKKYQQTKDRGVNNEGDGRSNRTPEREQQTPLFRSCSTSQLNTTLTYVKGDDPSEGIDLRIAVKDCKTVSCDNLAGQLILDDVFEPSTPPRNTSSNLLFYGRNFTESNCRTDSITPITTTNRVRKSLSCELRDSGNKQDVISKKSNFPYAFLRSKLSVLPEERNGAGVKQQPHDIERIFKTASEENFPSLIRAAAEDPSETTTLGRRRSRGVGTASGSSCFRIGGRNSYSEYRSPSYDNESRFSQSVDQFAASVVDYNDFDLTKATLRSQRRNSAPTAEQRLSSHYVSSNESGYDSDGPRGESTATSEAEAISLNRADSSDTSSVVDSEIEKPTRSSTPSEYAEQNESQQQSLNIQNQHQHQQQQQQGENSLDGLRWHQTTSGRILPSINHTEEKRESNDVNLQLPHRARLKIEKSRFLSDIIHPGDRLLQRRCRLVNLTKTDPSESLGIRLAQQRADNSVRYVVVELENKGIAHRDGRLRLGDEIVEVEGRDLGTLESLQAVQDFLASFRGSRIQLLTSYEENVPQLCDIGGSLGLLPGETEYFENANTLSNISLQDNKRSPGGGRSKRPEHLPLSLTSGPEALHFVRHTARFEKGYGRPSLGFSVVGGRDSPRGEMGIFVRRVFPGGQADISKSLFQGDEIISLNGKILRGFTHRQVIELFKAVREGPVELEVARRHRYPKSATESATY